MYCCMAERIPVLKGVNEMPELIDKHAAYIRLKTEAETHECYESKEAYNRAARIIDQMRTVEAEPVRHGTWKYGYNSDAGLLCYYCSACGKEAYWDTDYGQQRFDFCPMCGAKMDGGADNG